MRRKTKVGDLQGMADATVRKLRNLEAHIPADLELKSWTLPEDPIETGSFFDAFATKQSVLQEDTQQSFGQIQPESLNAVLQILATQSDFGPSPDSLVMVTQGCPIDLVLRCNL